MRLPKDSVHIDVVQYAQYRAVGYCICTALDGSGEIDSIYIEPEFRGSKIGAELINNGIHWLKRQGCNEIIVTVADGNEHVFPFYEKQGFLVRKTVLQLSK